MGRVKGKKIMEGRDKERRGGKRRKRAGRRKDREKVEISLPQREGGG